MLFAIFLISITIVLSIVKVDAFPTGAPVKHCSDMMPGHNVDPLDDLAPFHLIVTSIDSTKLKIKIQADSDNHFKGFLIEARSSLNKDEALGEWTTQEKHTKLLDCFNKSNSAVTHYFHDDDLTLRDGPHFSQLSFDWNYANMTALKEIHFVATIVKKFKQIYLNVTTSVKPYELIQNQSSDYFVNMLKLKKFFLSNLKVEYVHFSFLFLFVIILFVCLIMLHVLQIRRNNQNRYVLISNEHINKIIS